MSNKLNREKVLSIKLVIRTHRRDMKERLLSVKQQLASFRFTDNLTTNEAALIQTSLVNIDALLESWQLSTELFVVGTGSDE